MSSRHVKLLLPRLCSQLNFSSKSFHRQVVRKSEPLLWLSSQRFLYNNDQNEVFCNKCQAKLSAAILCDQCGAISEIKQPPSQNFFDLLQVNRSYNVDLKAMTQNFRSLQSVIHPDKFSNKSSEEQVRSADWSSLLNKAYATLSHPVKRGEYLLRLEGVTIPEQNESVNPEFLMEMMERNEEVAELKSRDEIDSSLEAIQNDLQQLYDDLGATLEKRDFNKALDVLVRIRYIGNLEQKLKEKQYSLT